MWWLMFLAASVCLLRWAWTGTWRRWPCAALFVAGYVISILLPHNVRDPHWWRSTWIVITGVLLPLRLAMLVEASCRLLRGLPDKRWMIAGGVSAAIAVVLILLPFRPLRLDYWSFVALRQYAQVAMAVFMGLLVMYAFMRPIRAPSRTHAMILLVLLLDYAVASGFEKTTGIASPFVVISAATWTVIRNSSNLTLALCFFAWAASTHQQPETISSEARE
jgi:hypothetical protein